MRDTLVINKDINRLSHIGSIEREIVGNMGDHLVTVITGISIVTDTSILDKAPASHRAYSWILGVYAKAAKFRCCP
jgi:hypothetical protein